MSEEEETYDARSDAAKIAFALNCINTNLARIAGSLEYLAGAIEDERNSPDNRAGRE